MAYRFEYSLPPSSWDGEPAPNRALFVDRPELAKPLPAPKGDFIMVPDGCSTGEVLPVEEPEWELLCNDNCGR